MYNCKITYSCLGFGGAQITENLTNAFFQTQPRQLLNDKVPCFPIDVPTNSHVRSSNISMDPVAGRNDLGFFVPCNARGGMQCNRVPNQLQTMLVPTASFFSQEFTRRVCTIDFEALVLSRQRARLIPSQIVQDGCYRVSFKIPVLEFGDLGSNDETEEPASDAVVVG